MAMLMSEFDVKKDFELAFGMPLEKATPAMVQFVADCGRHIRVRCRNNSALVNWLNNCFPSIRAKMVSVPDKQKPGAMFEALNITPRQEQKQVA